MCTPCMNRRLHISSSGPWGGGGGGGKIRARAVHLTIRGRNSEQCTTARQYGTCILTSKHILCITRARSHIHTSVHASQQTYTCVHTCIHVHAQTCTCAQTCTHTHTHYTRTTVASGAMTKFVSSARSSPGRVSTRQSDGVPGEVLGQLKYGSTRTNEQTSVFPRAQPPSAEEKKKKG